MFDLTHLPDADTAAHALAGTVANNLRTILIQKERATLAVSGGRSPIALFEILSKAQLEWHRINLTLVDERLVPTHHGDSNTALVRQYLLKNHAAHATWLPLVSDKAQESDLHNTQAAVDFANAHFVAPDIAILGMGTDGHTASIFPQAPQLNDALSSNHPQPFLHTSPITAPYERISLRLTALERIPYLYLAISGAEKEQVFQQAVEQRNDAYPISHLLHSSKAKIHVYLHS